MLGGVGVVCASVHCMYGCRWRLAASTGDKGLIMELQDHRGCLLFLKGGETDIRGAHKDH